MKRSFRIALIAALCCSLAGCSTPSSNGEKAAEPEKKQITINVACPPMTMAYDEDHPDAEVLDLLQEAGEKFSATYDKADVTFNFAKYQYVDEKEQVSDKIGTSEGPDVVIGGSFNMPTYIAEGKAVALDDVIDDALRADIDDAIWDMCKESGKTYILPFFSLQNTFMVNADLMRAAGLDEYIPQDGAVAHWSIDEFNAILTALKASMTEGGSFPLAFYAADNQGDTHTMTLLCAYGKTPFDEDGHFNLSAAEGIEALTWIAELNEQGIIPKGAENIDFLSNIKLFNNGQIAICPANLANYRVAIEEYNLDVFPANFPNPDGNGIATSYLNGFSVLDNGDPDKASVAKDFIRFIFSDDELMRYSTGGIPASESYVEKRSEDIPFLDMYSANAENTVNIPGNTLNWNGVRSAFYLNIQDLLRGTKTPEEVAAAIDESCNAAIDEGRALIESEH